MMRGNHRSFRLTPEPPESYMVGKRVVPRLWYINFGVGCFRFVLIYASIALFIVLIAYTPALNPEKSPYGIIGAIVAFLIVALMDFIGFHLGRRIVLNCGLMTKAEASGFHRSMHRWPESWLEDLIDQPHPLDDHGEPSDPPESPNRAI